MIDMYLIKISVSVKRDKVVVSSDTIGRIVEDYLHKNLFLHSSEFVESDYIGERETENRSN